MEKQDENRSKSKLNTEQRFSNFFDYAPIGFYRTLPDGSIILANPHLIKMLGFDTLDELKARNLEVDGFESAITRKKFKEFIEKHNNISEFKSIWKKKNGDLIFVSETAISVLNENNEIEYYEGIVKDITDEVTTENKIRQLAIATEQNPISIIITDTNAKIEYVNFQFEKVTGYSSAELIGQNAGILKSGSHHSGFYKNLWNTILAGNSWQDIFINKKKDGTLYWEKTTIAPVKTKDGQITHFVGMKEDISELIITEQKLKDSEQKFKDFLEFLPEVVFEMNLDFKIVFVNKKAFEIFLYTEDDLKNGLFAKDMVVEEDRRRLVENTTTVINNNQSILNEFTALRKDGSTFQCLIYSNLIKKENQITGINGILIDITERKEIEETIKRYNLVLQELNATKDKFFSIIAHDLKNPFLAISGLTDLILRSYDHYNKEKIQQFIESINQLSKNAFNLLENLLQWSRSQTGKISFSKTALNLHQLIDECKLSLNYAIVEKKIKYSNTIPETITILGDFNMLNTIFRNLISNAIKFSYPMGNITINAEYILTGDDKIVRISIADQGVGIEPENQKKLFKIDQHITTRGTNQEDGTGLGLILCKEFVEKHAGRIWVESIHQKGSTFFIDLPT